MTSKQAFDRESAAHQRNHPGSSVPPGRRFVNCSAGHTAGGAGPWGRWSDPAPPRSGRFARIAGHGRLRPAITPVRHFWHV